MTRRHQWSFCGPKPWASETVPAAVVVVVVDVAAAAGADAGVAVGVAADVAADAAVGAAADTVVAIGTPTVAAWMLLLLLSTMNAHSSAHCLVPARVTMPEVKESASEDSAVN